MDILLQSPATRRDAEDLDGASAVLRGHDIQLLQLHTSYRQCCHHPPDTHLLVKVVRNVYSCCIHVLKHRLGTWFKEGLSANNPPSLCTPILTTTRSSSTSASLFSVHVFFLGLFWPDQVNLSLSVPGNFVVLWWCLVVPGTSVRFYSGRVGPFTSLPGHRCQVISRLLGPASCGRR